MNEMCGNEDQMIETKSVDSGLPHEASGPSMFEIISGVLRRWYIVLPIFILLSSMLIPAIWLYQKPVYTVRGAIRVAPILTNLLSGKTERGSNVESFMNTQATMVTSTQVCERVADDLADKNIAFLQQGSFDPMKFLKQKVKGVEEKLGPVEILKRAIADGVISAVPAKRSQLIMVTMSGRDPLEARQIVDSFIQAYMAVEVFASTQGEKQTIKILESEQTDITGKLANLRSQIKGLADEFGSKTLDSRQEMKLGRVSMLLGEMTKYEALVLQLEAQVDFKKEKLDTLEELSQEEVALAQKESVPDPDDPARIEYISADPEVAALTSEVLYLKRALVDMAQSLTPTNPEYLRKQKVLSQLQEDTEVRKEEVGKIYDVLKVKSLARKDEQELINAKNELTWIESELARNVALKEKFKEMLSKEDSETISVGRTQLNIQEFEDELALTKETYDRITRRIQELEMESKRPARISVAFNADMSQKDDKRVKLSLASLFGSMACGVMLAFLKAKGDERLHSPNDLRKTINVRVIGTTASSHRMKKSLMPSQIYEDFQTIRANLSVLNSNGGLMPNILVITSPGEGEGKTTLSINLAISMAKAGKKVLLIDGDMRKPSISHLLDIHDSTQGIQDVLFGVDYKKVVHHMHSTGLDVLTSDSRDTLDAYELLASPNSPQYIHDLSKDYDQVIIDSPPILAFPDALIWAKMSDGVVMSCFIGRTTTSQLNIATERLEQIGAKLMGTVLSNVPREQGYYRYGYGSYGYNDSSIKKNKRKGAKPQLISLLEDKASKPE